MPNIKSFESREDWLNYYRQYREKNRKKLRDYGKKYNKIYRKKNGYHNEEKWERENPKEYKAQKLLRYAVKMRYIKKLPCAVCGRRYSVGGHHPDYDKPLEVIWLCALHHKHLHLGKIKVGIKSG